MSEKLAEQVAQNHIPVPVGTFSPAISLEAWLEQQMSQGVTQFGMHVRHNIDNAKANGFGVVGTLYPLGQDGETADFLFHHDRSECVTQIFLTEETMDNIQVFKDGTAWCALVGPDLVVGVAAFGDSPAAAVNALTNQIRLGIR